MQLYWPNGVRRERTQWRDKALSERHRAWGVDCPCADIDFLLTEYDLAKPVAVVEYKHYKAEFVSFDHPNYLALIDLADGYRDRGLPVFSARYWPEFWGFQIFPLNPNAKEHFHFSALLDERHYVMKLWELRALKRRTCNMEVDSLRKQFRNLEPQLFRRKPTLNDLLTAIWPCTTSNA